MDSIIHCCECGTLEEVDEEFYKYNLSYESEQMPFMRIQQPRD